MRESITDILDREHRARMDRNRLLEVDWFDDPAGGGDSGPTLNLSASTVADTASVGDVIGALSVSGGTGAYTYTFTSNPGTLFSITTNSLKVAAALTAGSDPITIKADNGAGSVTTRAFNITVTTSANTLQSDTGVDILADTSSPILVQ